MQTLTRMDVVVIDDSYHIMTMDDVNWIEPTHLLLGKILNFRGPFCTTTFTSEFLLLKTF